LVNWTTLSYLKGILLFTATVLNKSAVHTMQAAKANSKMILCVNSYAWTTCTFNLSRQKKYGINFK